MSTEIILSSAPELQPAALFTPTPKAARRVLELFTAQINNDHTRKAYLNATRRFAEWCNGRGIAQLTDVGLPQVRGWGTWNRKAGSQVKPALSPFHKSCVYRTIHI